MPLIITDAECTITIESSSWTNPTKDDEEDNKENTAADEERAETSSPEAEKSQNVEEEAATQAVQVRGSGP